MRKIYFVAFVVALLTLNCGDDEPDMALTKRSIDWPILGGIDTKRSPFALAPGSNLRAEDVRQERLGEWRRRDGYSQSDVDTLPEAAPFALGRIGDSGMFENGQAGFATYAPSVSVGRWTTPSISTPPQHRSRMPIVESDSQVTAFGRVGNIVAAGYRDNAGHDNVVWVDSASGAILGRAGAGGTFSAIRGAATARYLCIFLLDTGGSGLTMFAFDTVTNTLAAPVTLKTGMSLTPYLDAMWYGGATITVVCRDNTDAIRFIEVDPSTATKATDTTVAGVSCATTLSLLPDPDASGVRFVASSHTTPTSRVTRCSSAGVVLTDDQIEAVQSTHITGVASVGGVNWNVVYQTTTPNLRLNNKTGGVVGTPVALQGSATWGASGTVDSQAWREPAINGWFVLLGMHSQNIADPQDTWVEAFLPLGNSGTGFIPVSTPVTGAASPKVGAGQLFQVVRTSAYHFSYALPVQVTYEDNANVIVRHYSVDLFDQTYLTGADLAASPTGKSVQFGATAYVPAGQLSFYDGGTLRPLGTRTPPRILSVTPSVGAGLLTSGKIYGYAADIEQLDADGNAWRGPPTIPVLVTMSSTQNTNTLVFSSWALEANSYYRLVLYRTQGDGSDYRRIYSQLFVAGADITYVDLLADSAIKDSQFLYTTGETPTAITPAASMLALSNGRLWYVNREYPTEVGYSKKLRPGRLPEMTDDQILDSLTDEFGDVTGIVGMDSNTVIFKESATYTASGDGLDDAGAGNNYTVSRIDGAIGAIKGSPVLSLGAEAYFVSTLGIQRLGGTLGHSIDFVGSPVDAFLHQPQINTPETVRDIVYVPKWDEVRFVTNASILVYNRTFQIWYRFKGALASGSPLLHSVVIGGRQYITREDGKVFVEGDTSQLLDGVTDFDGFLRSQWVIPAGSEGRFRLYLARILAIRTGGGSSVLPRMDIFTDYDDANPLSFEPVVTVGATDATVRLEGRPSVTEAVVNSFSEQITFPRGDNTWRIERWAAVVGVKPGYQRLGSDAQMKE